MTKKIITGIVVIAVLVLGYNYFFGTVEEKTQSKNVAREVKEAGLAIKDLLQSEKEKFDQGKYDKAIAKTKTAVLFLRERTAALHLDQKIIDRLEARQQRAEKLAADSELSKNSDKQAAAAAELDALLREIETIEIPKTSTQNE